MTIDTIHRPVRRVTFRTALIAAGILAFAGQASAVEVLKRTQTAAGIGGLTTGQRGARVTPVPCNSVSACNNIIAYCAEKGGNWIETSHDPQGRPSSGTCYLP